MSFTLRMGTPEMEGLWKNLLEKHESGELKGPDKLLFKKMVKALRFLEDDPRHNSLQSHEISSLSRRYGHKVWQSYLENNTPGAGRLFWVYGPGKSEITIIGLEPHPEDVKREAYSRIRLSQLPPLE
jgi:hypothetical protein